ncbi:MAG: 16S rRNA (guanine(527)-N(7))-methyltransferase RsmG [Porticoccaceae bacterium]|nr:16S rRNA (guanine(527)-N(7))-methyltransferase RsmG [Porticoccaceae bacterium]
MGVCLESRLRGGLDELSLSLDDRQIEQLLCYLDMLEKWNRAYNLTAIEDPAAMVSLHLLDSLAIAPYLRGRGFVDVGTGPGLPGIPLAIAFPEREFVLLDSNGKRMRFLFQVRTELGLANVTEIKSRVEHYRPDILFDGVISRAFTALRQMVSSTAHLRAPSGRFYAMKGRYPDMELSELPKPYNVSASHRLQVPGVDGERHLIEIGSTP